MDEPNLQTIPHPVNYDTTASETPQDAPSNGHQHRSSYRFNVRAAFRAPEGWLILSADYSQLEFRLMAHFSGDEGLQQMFRDPGGDPFRLLAEKWLDQAAQLEKIGVPRERIFNQTLITPSCGTGSIDLPHAVKVLELTRDLSAKLRAMI